MRLNIPSVPAGRSTFVACHAPSGTITTELLSRVPPLSDLRFARRPDRRRAENNRLEGARHGLQRFHLARGAGTPAAHARGRARLVRRHRGTGAGVALERLAAGVSSPG